MALTYVNPKTLETARHPEVRRLFAAEDLAVRESCKLNGLKMSLLAGTLGGRSVTEGATSSHRHAALYCSSQGRANAAQKKPRASIVNIQQWTGIHAGKPHTGKSGFPSMHVYAQDHQEADMPAPGESRHFNSTA